MSPRDARIPDAVIEAMQGASGAEWSVLAALYLHANGDGLCNPSIGTIGHIAASNRRTVTRALAQLEERGVVLRDKPAPGRTTTTYRLSTRGETAPSDNNGLGVKSSQTRGEMVPRLGVKRPPKQRPLNSEEQSPCPLCGSLLEILGPTTAYCRECDKGVPR